MRATLTNRLNPIGLYIPGSCARIHLHSTNRNSHFTIARKWLRNQQRWGRYQEMWPRPVVNLNGINYLRQYNKRQFSGQHNGAWSLQGMGDKALMAEYYVNWRSTWPKFLLVFSCNEWLTYLVLAKSLSVRYLIHKCFLHEHAKVVFMLMGNTVPSRPFRGISFLNVDLPCAWCGNLCTVYICNISANIWPNSNLFSLTY